MSHPPSATSNTTIASAQGAAVSLRALLEEMIERDASDLHITAGERAKLRVDGDIVNSNIETILSPKDTLQLATLLDEDSTFFGDLFAHVVEWRDDLYLEDGLHRALRAALQQRLVLHARVLVLDDAASGA